MKRILTGLALGAVVWTLIKIVPAWAFFVLAGVILMVSAWECFRLGDLRGVRPIKIVGMAACLGLVVSFTRSDPWLWVVITLTAAVTASVVASMAMRDEPVAMMRSAVSTVFPVVFVGLGLGFALGLRTFPDEDGKDLLMMLVVCLTALDSAAYYTGKRFGRHHMAPTISPKKTWEGAAGGVVACVGAALLAHVWFYQRLPLHHAVVLGAIIAVSGIVGDLAESMIKRAAGAKDSSALLPGHGGMLDRIDSMLFTGPVLYFYYLVFLKGVT
jgi:phosphatidate cytidylyltransferase